MSAAQSADTAGSAAAAIRSGQTYLGIELGSTRIKACLINSDTTVLATGAHEWESRLVDGLWTYSLEDVWTGLQEAVAALSADCNERFGAEPTVLAGLGISAMMHGYLAFDEQQELLVPFRTWRNTNSDTAARELTELFGVNIPHRWSVAHFYQAVLDGEASVAQVAHLTTLAGYVHFMLTGERVLGVGDASGMFPISAEKLTYEPTLQARFDELLDRHGVTQRSAHLFPRILSAGQPAGHLTPAGAALLDPSGALQPGAPMCPPEGDAGTGMVATGSLAPRTGNVSVGTSIFAMVVLEAPLATARPEIDVVTTPVGDPVAMVHCNNGANELAAWVALFRQWAAAAGSTIGPDEAFAALLGSVTAAAPDADTMVLYNFTAGEPVVGITEGRPLLVRSPDSALDLPNFARVQVFGIYAALSVGMQLLAHDGVALDRMFAHGGMFRTPGVAQRLLAAALNTPVTVAQTGSEGGAWGMAVLAAYLDASSQYTLDDYLRSVAFADIATVTTDPEPDDVAGYAQFLDRYIAGLPMVRTAR